MFRLLYGSSKACSVVSCPAGLQQFASQGGHFAQDSPLCEQCLLRVLGELHQQQELPAVRPLYDLSAPPCQPHKQHAKLASLYCVSLLHLWCMITGTETSCTQHSSRTASSEAIIWTSDRKGLAVAKKPPASGKAQHPSAPCTGNFYPFSLSSPEADLFGACLSALATTIRTP